MATTKKTTTKKTAPKEATEAVAEKKAMAAEPVQVSEPAPTVQKVKPVEIDLHQFVAVRSGAPGKLIYVSPKTNERFVWEEFGDVQDMELQELRGAKAANKKFFERNWFMFDEEYDWVIDFLGVRHFYKNAIGVDSLDDVFSMKPAELQKVLDNLSDGQRKAIAHRAIVKIQEGELDSMKVIDTLEKSLGITLIER